MAYQDSISILASQSKPLHTECTGVYVVKNINTSASLCTRLYIIKNIHPCKPKPNPLLLLDCLPLLGVHADQVNSSKVSLNNEPVLIFIC